MACLFLTLLFDADLIAAARQLWVKRFNPCVIFGSRLHVRLANEQRSHKRVLSGEERWRALEKEWERSFQWSFQYHLEGGFRCGEFRCALEVLIKMTLDNIPKISVPDGTQLKSFCLTQRAPEVPARAVASLPRWATSQGKVLMKHAEVDFIRIELNELQSKYNSLVSSREHKKLRPLGPQKRRRQPDNYSDEDSDWEEEEEEEIGSRRLTTAHMKHLTKLRGKLELELARLKTQHCEFANQDAQEKKQALWFATVDSSWELHIHTIASTLGTSLAGLTVEKEGSGSTRAFNQIDVLSLSWFCPNLRELWLYEVAYNFQLNYFLICLMGARNWRSCCCPPSFALIRLPKSCWKKPQTCRNYTLKLSAVTTGVSAATKS